MTEMSREEEVIPENREIEIEIKTTAAIETKIGIIGEKKEGEITAVGMIEGETTAVAGMTEGEMAVAAEILIPAATTELVGVRDLLKIAITAAMEVVDDIEIAIRDMTLVPPPDALGVEEEAEAEAVVDLWVTLWGLVVEEGEVVVVDPVAFSRLLQVVILAVDTKETWQREVKERCNARIRP